jgi:ferritin-like metal-binding protein YciE
MKLQSHQDLFIAGLKDLYDAEKQLTKALPKMIKAASDEDLKQALEEHRSITEGQVKRLEDVFKELGLPAKGKKSEIMKTIIDEGKTLMDMAENDQMTDAAIMMAAQHVEHHEMAGYMAAMNYAELLGYESVAELLEQTLEEEEEAAEKIAELSETIEVEGNEEEEEDEE